MPKPKFSSRLKIAFLNIMQAFGSAASQMASNAKLRVNEINLESRRHEILTEFSLQAFAMWHNGVKLPKELSDMFTELSEIDDKLSILRAQKFAKVHEDSVDALQDNTAACTVEPEAAGDTQPATEIPSAAPKTAPEAAATADKPAAEQSPRPHTKPATAKEAFHTQDQPAAKKPVSAAQKKPRVTIKKSENAAKSKE